MMIGTDWQTGQKRRQTVSQMWKRKCDKFDLWVQSEWKWLAPFGQRLHVHNCLQQIEQTLSFYWAIYGFDGLNVNVKVLFTPNLHNEWGMMWIALAIAHMIFPDVSTYTLVFIVKRDSDLTDVIIPAPILSVRTNDRAKKKGNMNFTRIAIDQLGVCKNGPKINYYSQLLCSQRGSKAVPFRPLHICYRQKKSTKWIILIN